MGLFANSRQANINSAIAMVEDVLVELGYFLNDSREAAPGDAVRAWTVRKGSALVRILVSDDQKDVHLRVVSVVMTLTPDVDEASLYRHLLTMNNRQIQGAAFAIEDSRVLLLTERSTMDLDRSEVLDVIERVRHYADDYDDLLVSRFGGLLGTGSEPSP